MTWLDWFSLLLKLKSLQIFLLGKRIVRKFIWKNTTNGICTMRPRYREARNLDFGASMSSSSNCQVVKLWHALWKLEVPNKVKIFIWSAWNNAIPCMHEPVWRYIRVYDVSFHVFIQKSHFYMPYGAILE